MYAHILIPTDGSALSQATLRRGIDFARACGARVTLLASSLPLDSMAPEWILDSKSYQEATARVARERLHPGVEYARKRRVKAQAVHACIGEPWQAIVKVAKRRGCDLVFMASHGRRGMEALLLGSETQKVLAHSKVPVLVCR